MIDCPRCGASFPDSPDSCPHCDGKAASDPALQRDTRKFILARELDGPLITEQATAQLEAEGIPVYARPRHAVEGMGTSASWWEILVPEDLAERAGRMIDEMLQSLEANAEEAAQAAEEEEAEWERTHGESAAGK